MADMAEATRLVDELSSFRTRARARRRLERMGPAVADAVVPLIRDKTRSENVRWAAILLVQAWKHAPATASLLEVVRTHTGLRGSAEIGRASCRERV